MVQTVEVAGIGFLSPLVWAVAADASTRAKAIAAVKARERRTVEMGIELRVM
jgi:hypothetical protein